MEVAAEMVKELDITDWDPLQIADMIDTEISDLIPEWKKSPSLQNYEQQHSFNYVEDDDNDDDDENTPHPFYYNSSHSSSQLSLPGLLPSYKSTFHQGKLDHDWLQGLCALLLIPCLSFTHDQLLQWNATKKSLFSHYFSENLFSTMHFFS